jgi:ABC-type branched-subunit amino acid transport system ATPase component
MPKTAGLAERYARPTALRSPNPDVPAGRPVSLHAPNAAGGPTLFQGLTGPITADRGDVQNPGRKGA